MKIYTQRKIIAKVYPTNTRVKNRRIYISIKYKRLLLEKANHCCEYKNSVTGEKCRAKHQLEIDHIQPLALGGSNEIKNLRILCKTHNLLAAKNAGLAY